MARYGARGPLALERLSRREDGKLAYRLKRRLPGGVTTLVLTPVQLLKRLCALMVKHLPHNAVEHRLPRLPPLKFLRAPVHSPSPWRTAGANAAAEERPPSSTHQASRPAERHGCSRAPGQTLSKQYTRQAFCGMGADRNVLQRVTQPTVIIDRTPPPAATAPSAAPTGLYPADGSVVSVSYAKLMAGSDSNTGAARSGRRR